MIAEWSDSELIWEIMEKAPRSWRTQIDISTILNFRDFQDKIAWWEEDLMDKSQPKDSSLQRQLDRMQTSLQKLESRQDKKSHWVRSRNEI
jgi:hypothetical protein